MPEDIVNNQQPTGETVYTETVVEYVDNRRSRTVLAAILVLLFLLLIGVGFFIVRISQPAAPPKKADLPTGVSWVRSFYAWGRTPDTMMTAPVDADIAPDGTVWVTTNKRVLVGFDQNGQTRRVITRPNVGAPGGFISIEGLAVDPDTGDLYVAEFGRNSVMVFGPNGELKREFGVELPMEIDVRDGKVAVAAAYGIGIFDTEGKLITQWGQRGKEEADVDLPHGIAIGPDGNVYVSDTQNKRIKAYTQDGRLLWIKSSKVAGDLKSKVETETIDGVIQNMQIPSSLTFDNAGRLLLVDPFEFQILVLDPAKKGQVVARYGEFGQEDGKFAYPTGIAYDPARDLIAVADTSNNRAQLIRLPDTGGSAIRRNLAWATDQPIWLCAIPLLLLLAAVVVSVLRRRRAKKAEAEPTAGEPLADM